MLKLQPMWNMSVWELGGSAAVRDYWPHYYTNDTASIIWVLDGNDAPRMREAQDMLLHLLGEPALRGIPLLLFVNECPRLHSGKSGKLSANEVADRFELKRVCGLRPFLVQECCAMDGSGLEAGFKWLSAEFIQMLG